MHDRRRGLAAFIIFIIPAQRFRGGIAAFGGSIFIWLIAVICICLLLGLFNQRFAVFDRDTIIIRVDFAKGQKALAVAAIFNKGRLQGWLNAGYARQIYISFELLKAGILVIELFDFVAIQQYNPCFLGLMCIDQ